MARVRSNPIEVVKMLPEAVSSDPKAYIESFNTDVRREMATLLAPSYGKSTEDAYKNSKHDFKLFIVGDHYVRNLKTAEYLAQFQDKNRINLVYDISSRPYYADTKKKLHKVESYHDKAKHYKKIGNELRYLQTKSVADGIPKPLTIMHMAWEDIDLKSGGSSTRFSDKASIISPIYGLFMWIKEYMPNAGITEEYIDTCSSLLDAIIDEYSKLSDQIAPAIFYYSCQELNLNSSFWPQDRVITAFIRQYIRNAVNSKMCREGFSQSLDQSVIDMMALCELTPDSRPLILEPSDISIDSFRRIIDYGFRGLYGGEHGLSDKIDNKGIKNIRDDVANSGTNITRLSQLIRTAYNMITPCIYGSVISLTLSPSYYFLNGVYRIENTSKDLG